MIPIATPKVSQSVEAPMIRKIVRGARAAIRSRTDEPPANV
jgi:hypothetical protein